MSKKNKKDVGTVLGQDGVTFRVWAPFAENVTLAGTFNNWGRTPLASEGDGYWSVTVKDAKAGEEYKYAITANGQEWLKNDPRSLQVTTDAGNSVVVDLHFDWHDKGFH